MPPPFISVEEKTVVITDGYMSSLRSDKYGQLHCCQKEIKEIIKMDVIFFQLLV